MRVEADQVPEGLDGDLGPRYAFSFIQGLTEELLQTIAGAPAELAQKFSIESDIGPENLGKSQGILSME